MKKFDFFSKDRTYRPHQREHGGSLLLGKRKLRRPLHSKKSLHIVSKTHPNAPSLKNARTRELVEKYAERYRIRIKGLEILDDHYHLLVTFTRADDLHNFLKVTNGMIARTLACAEKGKPRGKFWLHRAYTRVVASGADWRNVAHYFFKNRIEAELGKEARLAFEYDPMEFQFQYGERRGAR